MSTKELTPEEYLEQLKNPQENSDNLKSDADFEAKLSPSDSTLASTSATTACSTTKASPKTSPIKQDSWEFTDKEESIDPSPEG